jgi:hypothetical protein
VTARTLSSCGTSIDRYLDSAAFSFLPPGMNWALLGLPAGVAILLVPTASSVSSFRVRR